MTSFVTRTISGAFVLFLSILCLYFKGISLIFYALFVNLFCLLELIKAFKIKDFNLKIIAIALSTLITCYIRSLNIFMFLVILILYFVVMSIYYLFLEKINILDFIKLTFIFIYISIPMGLFLNLGNTNDIWLIYIISWGTDTFAYLVGVLFGKHKLCPNISPKKTIEGAIGGILGSVILLNIFNIYIFKYNPIFINLVAIFSSIVAQIGDLFASKIKREANIKDFGNLISGHGGVLDRFDSIVFLTPVIYVIFYVFGGNI